MLKSILQLASSSIIVQIISFSIMPIITRLHTPNSLGEYQFFTTVALLLAPLMSGSFAIAIKSSRNRYQAYLNLKAGILFSIIFLIFLILISPIVIYLINNSSIKWFSTYYFLLIFFVFLSSNFQFALSFMVNTRVYKEQSLMELNKGIFLNIFKLLFSYISKTGFSLIYALLVTEIIQLLGIIKKNSFFLKKIILKSKMLSLKNEIESLRKYPTYVTFSTFISTLFNWFPILITGYIYGSDYIGLLGLAFMVVNTPVYPFVNILQNICFGELSRHGLSQINFNVYKKIIFITFIPSVMGLFTLYFYGESLFAFVFGREWRVAGKYAFFCFIPISFSMMLFPIYSTLNQILGLQKNFLKIQILLLIVILTLFFILSANGMNFNTFVIFYAILMVIVHLVLFLTSLRFYLYMNHG